MKRFFFSLMSFLVLCVSCTDNDDTGDLYGQWQITTIKDRGIILSTPDNLYLSFQGNIVFARIADHENYKYVSIPGVFKEKKDSLYLSFYVDNNTIREIISEQYCMNGDPKDQHFSLTMKSDCTMLANGSRQWQMRRY